MANDPDFVAHCRELLAPLGAVRQRRMFGGHGLYLDDHFIAIVSANVLYLKADDDTRGQFEAAGCQPFAFHTADGQRTVLSYWQAPDDAIESAPAMAHWARLALGAALRQAQAKALKATPRARRAAPAKPASKAPPAKAPARPAAPAKAGRAKR